MKHYEYHVAEADLKNNKLVLLGQGEQYNEEHTLDMLGSKGWELIQVAMLGTRGGGIRQFAIFKREAATQAEGA